VLCVYIYRVARVALFVLWKESFALFLNTRESGFAFFKVSTFSEKFEKMRRKCYILSSAATNCYHYYFHFYFYYYSLFYSNFARTKRMPLPWSLYDNVSS
jgi:hypothetical protein